jgi:hypothetical protein
MANGIDGYGTFQDGFESSVFGSPAAAYPGPAATAATISYPFDFFATAPTEGVAGGTTDSPDQPSVERSKGRKQKPRLFEPREQPPGSEHRVAMACGMLYSYPDLMKQRKTFPPFIHPQGNGTAEDNWLLPIPLSNAMGIAQMFHARSVDTSGFIWQTIRHEQQRIYQEVGA